MNEPINILEDIASGALPLSDIPRFFFWLLGKSFWPWIGLIIVGVLVWLGITFIP